MRRLAAMLAAIVVTGGVALAEDEAPAEKILARGAVTVSTASDATHHWVYLRDKHGHSIDLILDDPVDAGRATVTPLSGERSLLHVTLFVDDAKRPYHVEHHYIVRPHVDADLELVCDIPGSATVPPEPASRVTLRQTSSKPLRLDVDTRIGAATKRQRFTIPSGQLCEGPESVAATTPAEEAGVRAALKAGKYRDAKILDGAGHGAFVALGVYGTVDEPSERLLLVTPGATPALLVLGEQVGMHNAADGVRVEGYGAFLGRRDLFDLQVSSSWSNGMGGSSATRHYLLRSGTPPRLACTVEGNNSGGMEDVNHSSSASFEKVSDEPFTFSIKRTSSTNHRHPGTAEGDLRASEPCTVPSRGTCDCNLGR